MASWVLSECGLRPLPQVSPRPRTRIAANPIKLPTLQKNNFADLGFGSTRISSGRFRRWGVKVSAPLKVASTEEDEAERMRVNGVNGDEEGIEFDPGSPPPFKLGDVRAAIPKHCWVKDPWRSMSYVVRDVLVVFGLAAAAFM